MSKINWGIIGCGKIAIAFSLGVKGSATGVLYGAASRDLAKAEKFAADNSVQKAFGSYDALLADKNVNAVYVATPHPQHAEWAIKAARAGKHVLVEKPFALNHAEAMAMFEAAYANNVFMMEAFMYRCHPQTAALVQLLNEKAIGDVKVIQATFSYNGGFNPDSRTFNNDLGGGGILDVGCYATSAARLIAGAVAGQRFADPTAVSGVGQLASTGVDNIALATLKFPGDILAQLATGVGVNQENVVRIFGTEGSIVVPNPWVANRKGPDAGKIIVNAKGGSREVTQTTDKSSFGLEVDVFGKAVLNGTFEPAAPAHNRDDTLGNMKTLDRWRDAIGLLYNQEKPDAVKQTVSRGPLAAKPNSPMLYGTFPHVDRKVSRLVMGCDNQQTMPHTAVMFDDYFERGGNTFDTAWQYGGGKQERLLGQWLTKRGVRDQVNLIVKGGHSPFCDPRSINRQLIESLERLQTDHAELYLLHRDNPEFPVSVFVETLNEHVKAGRIKGFGGSNWTTARVDEANAYAKAKGLQGFEALSNNFSLARMVNPVWGGCVAASDPESRAWLTKTQTPVISWSSQARGFFTDRSGKDKTGDRELSNAWYSDDNFQRKERVYELAKKLNVTPISIALAYVLHQPFPTFALIGPRTLEETRTSFDGLSVKLTAERVKWLNLEA